MKRLIDRARTYGTSAAEALSEAVWPTRCVVCDVPGTILCDTCALQLPYLDWWRACPICGAPFGRTQCTECNRIMMAQTEMEKPPFDGCASVVVFSEGAARLVRAYKDHGERRAAAVIARLMHPVMHPSWLHANPTIVWVPATSQAVRKRGFDHMAEIARTLGDQSHLKRAQPLSRPKTADQRRLDRISRIGNLQGRFAVQPGAMPPSHVLLIDDVYTTGATLFAATDALKAAGAQTVHCLTFARVF